MITGASTADLAVILIDARKGVLTQTRRHSFLAHLIGIRHVVVAVNKMDLIAYERRKFEAIIADYRTCADGIGITEFLAMPISALAGDNVFTRSSNTPWYRGPSLIEHLETVSVDIDAAQTQPFCMPVQWVERPNPDFRGFSGFISAGTLRVGDKVRALPSGLTSQVARILAPEGDSSHAVAGQSVTICLGDQVDCSRGDVLAAVDAAPQVADQFEATIVWMAEEPMLAGRPYWLKLATQIVSATVQAPKYEVNVNTMDHLAAKTLTMNSIGVANLATDRPIVFESYEVSHDLGGFILIDKLTNATVAAGMLHFALRRSQNVHWQALDISREARATMKNQKPAVLWFTGLSGAGKSTIANLVEKKLHRMNRHTFLLDGDNVRHGLNRDLGFTDADRVENIRRVGEVARLMTDAGIIVITAFISPFSAERRMVRDMMFPGEFIEIYIDTPLAEAERRDVKGLYKKARAGQLANFTGIASSYEPPIAPDVHIDTTKMTPEQAANLIVEHLVGPV
jgi:bifunctional enzyme CysN/CysC